MNATSTSASAENFIELKVCDHVQVVQLIMTLVHISDLTIVNLKFNASVAVD